MSRKWWCHSLIQKYGTRTRPELPKLLSIADLTFPGTVHRTIQRRSRGFGSRNLDLVGEMPPVPRRHDMAGARLMGPFGRSSSTVPLKINWAWAPAPA